MNPDELKDRFKKFAITVVKATEKFPKGQPNFTITDQIVRCSTSSAANYRAACRGKSLADFINKLKIVEEELDETNFWLEFSIDVNEQFTSLLTPLLSEGQELLSIIVASLKTARKRQLENTSKVAKTK